MNQDIFLNLNDGQKYRNTCKCYYTIGKEHGANYIIIHVPMTLAIPVSTV